MSDDDCVKITIDIQPQDMRDMMRIAGEKKRTDAVSKFLAHSLQLSRRREVMDNFITGKWGTEGVSGSEKKQGWIASK
jgi:hypothetical protein